MAATLEEIDRVFEALAHGTRRHVVMLLAHKGGELSSGWLAARFQHSWPTTTRHLAVLQEAGIVTVRREGRASFYRLERAWLRRVLEGWTKHLVPVDPKETWAPQGPRTTRELERRAEKEEHEHTEDLPRDRRSRRSRGGRALLRRAARDRG